MRPVYETDHDRERQGFVAEKLCEAWRIDLKPSPRMYAVDFFAVRPDGSIVAFVEIKVRDVSVRTYPTLLLSYHKYRMGMALATPEAPFILAAGWRDGIGWLRPPRGLAPRIGGRVDRNDPQDVEPVVDFPIGDFRFIMFP